MNEANYDLIKRYYLGRLSPAERADLEQRLAADDAFAREAAEYAALYELAQTEGDRRLDDELRVLGKQLLHTMETTPRSDPGNKPNQTAKMTSFTRILYAAAAVAGLLIVALPLWLLNRPERAGIASPSELYSDNFSLPPAPEARDEVIEPWREAYMAGEYADAIAALEQLLADSTYRARSEGLLYLGLSYLAVDRPQDALTALGQVSPDSFHFADAQWYRALAYLKLDQPADARQLLSAIAADARHPHREEAGKLLDGLGG